ncbi:MAG: hypothetical protein HY332_16585 [Chloroflexi bacterium]|nr:hypothetical protein [Chloroflexota bacterium]
MEPRKTVAAIVTEYRVRSHADNIVTRLLEGYELHWTPVQPRVRVASLYTDQVPANDISRDLAGQYDVPIFPTIREALTLGGDGLAVDGVVLVGEHGDYPYNEKGQHLYPRRRFFEEVVGVFRDSGRVAPVFNDKHLAWNWHDAKWMVDTAREMGIPFMAGSSMPVTPRIPPMQVPLGADVEEIVVVAHGGLESYGFHALEIGQCLAERRKGFETGVESVQCLAGAAFWDAYRAAGSWSRDLEDAALAVAEHGAGTPLDYYAARFAAGAPGSASGAPHLGRREGSEPAIYRIEYRDGLRLTVLMLNGYMTQRGAAVRVRGESAPLAACFTQARRQPVWHFDHQVDFIERLVITGAPPYPVERTLLTTGMIDAVMISRHEGGRPIETPYLDVVYRPAPLPGYYQRSFLPPSLAGGARR